MKNIVVLTGAGISAESGIKTFRGNDGLWENHKVTDVATPEAWQRDPELVLRFYNQRRKQIRHAQPNQAHLALAELESAFKVKIITQNIDDLHERAGSSDVMHLHGEINQSRSSINPDLVYKIDDVEMKIGELCEMHSQLRPNIVWFGEAVPMIDSAIKLMPTADIILVVGTSLQVYPAAGLLDFASQNTKIYSIDPVGVLDSRDSNITVLKQKAGEALPGLVRQLLASL
ncbi:MAG: NAD-dependent deacetylase [Marinicellaceae bacterium]